MADLDLSKFVYILLLTSATADLVVSRQHYIEHSLSEEKICHPLGEKRKPLNLWSDKTAVVVMKPKYYAYERWQSLCRFTFKVGKGEHLFAVIQNMYLRTNGIGCQDYIKFKRKDKNVTQEFCGRIDRRTGLKKITQEIVGSEIDTENQNPHDYAQFDLQGEIETTIHLSGVAPRSDEELDITIVYTPYYDCDKIVDDRDEYQTMSNNICIRKEYMCDGYQNCVYDICRDEEGCKVVSNGTGTKVTIGAVTTMLLCFIIFIMGLWICRRHKKMCWSSDCAGPSIHDNRLARAERDATGSANPATVAVSPMLEVAIGPTVLDKDLPPSYDSLFPEQANPSTT